jgi:hypothetical protein
VTIPLAYAVLLLFHPIPGAGLVEQGLDHHLTTWNVVHVAQLGFIGAMGGALLWLVHGLTARSAIVARVSAVVFILVYGAYETWTGIATGALTRQRPWSAGRRAVDGGPAHPGAPGIAAAGQRLGRRQHGLRRLARRHGRRRAGPAQPRGGHRCRRRVGGAGLVFAPTHVPPAGPVAMLRHRTTTGPSWRCGPRPARSWGTDR